MARGPSKDGFYIRNDSHMVEASPWPLDLADPADDGERHQRNEVSRRD